jgi:hypothetical protein
MPSAVRNEKPPRVQSAGARVDASTWLAYFETTCPFPSIFTSCVRSPFATVTLYCTPLPSRSTSASIALPPTCFSAVASACFNEVLAFWRSAGFNRVKNFSIGSLSVPVTWPELPSILYSVSLLLSLLRTLIA